MIALRIAPCCFAVALIAAGACPVLAQPSGGPYTLREAVIAAGGVRAAAAPFSATMTTGQPTAVTVAAGRFRLVGGFHWPAARAPSLFRDGFENPPPPPSPAAGSRISQGAPP